MDPTGTLCVERVVRGEEFDNAKDLRTRVQQSFLIDHRYCRSVSSGGRQRKFVCTGRELEGGKNIGCCAVVRAHRSRKSNLWKLTKADLEHENCSGEQKGASAAAVADFVSILVRVNPRMSAADICNTVRAQNGIDVHKRTALRCKELALNATAIGMEEGFHVMSSFLGGLESASHGTVASAKVSRGQTQKAIFHFL